MPKSSSLQGFLPATSFAMGRLVKEIPAPAPQVLDSTPQSATTLFGRGNSSPALLFVGESFNEEATLLLNKMIEAMGVKVSDVFVAEIHAQLVLTSAHFESFQSKLIVLLGEVPTRLFLGGAESYLKHRGKIHLWNGYSVLVSFSPNHLLQTPFEKKNAWEDLKFAMKHLGWKS